MGLEMNAQNETNVPYVKAVENISSIVYKRMFNPLYAIDFFYKLTKEHKLFQESMKVVSETTQKC
uniref:Uncharacterized protein n=1 Tax=Megaselia scalaris TaxID=36166 RepID=T1GZZ6_MEGSC